MKHLLFLTLYLALGPSLLMAAPAYAQSTYPGPSAEVSSGVIPPPIEGQGRLAANVSAGSSHIVTSGPETANPAGAVASR
jgi:hypothetical protein